MEILKTVTVKSHTFPFPFTVVDDFITDSVLDALLGEINSVEDWRIEDGAFNLKHSQSRVGPAAWEVINSLPIPWIERLVGIENLVLDPHLSGGGYHSIPAGGFLHMHTDFNQHPDNPGLRRAVNILIYLNRDWDPAWGGDLKLGYNQEASIEPIAKRAVVFATNDGTWHGHPKPLACPPDVTRKSLAIYLYTEEKVTNPHSTVYIKPEKERKKRRKK